MAGQPPIPSCVKRRLLLIVTALCVAALAAFLHFAPPHIDGSRNRVHAAAAQDTRQDAAAQALHQRLTIADLHADSLLWNRDLLRENTWGHVDVPRLIKGNVALQAFGVVTKTPRHFNIERNSAASDEIRLLTLVQRWPPPTWASLLERALYQARKLHEFAAASNGKLVIIKTRAELAAYLDHRRTRREVTAGWLTIEGAHALHGDLGALAALYDAGYRMISPAHLADSEVSSSASGEAQRGLTPLGARWVAEMERRGMIIDLAHASALTITEVLALAKRPVIVSHTGVKGTCNNNRNLSDDQLRRIAARGGLIGIGFWPFATCGEDVNAIVRAIAHTVKTAGIEHVALGSDWDGAVATPIDAAHAGALTAALLKAGFDEGAIRKIMGENAIAFLLRALP